MINFAISSTSSWEYLETVFAYLFDWLHINYDNISTSKTTSFFKIFDWKEFSNFVFDNYDVRTYIDVKVWYDRTLMIDFAISRLRSLDYHFFDINPTEQQKPYLCICPIDCKWTHYCNYMNRSSSHHYLIERGSRNFYYLVSVV